MTLLHTESFVRTHVTGRPESLLTQDLASFHDQLTAEIAGKKALVIGGAGTIGSSFIRALLRYNPATLVVVDINENGLTELVRDLRSRSDLQVPADFTTYPVNFSDPVFYKIFEARGPFDIVANFAAHKHVRSEKDVFSIEAMVDNNVLKAKTLLDFLLQHKPRHFFCVSTDKAANPVNVMGASKKLMEEVILAYSKEMKITTARFANVAFSNGSLPLGFVERLFKRQPLSCPADVRRFFVSPQESGEICLAACILGRSGEIFYPKLSEADLKSFASFVPAFLKEFGFDVLVCASEEEARQAADQLQSNPNATAYPVYFFSSDTDGEKLYEEFYSDEETRDESRFAQLGVVTDATARSREALDKVVETIAELFAQKHLQKSQVIDSLKTLLPGFSHIETGKSLDQKM